MDDTVLESSAVHPCSPPREIRTWSSASKATGPAEDDVLKSPERKYLSAVQPKLRESKGKKPKSLPSFPLLGPNDVIGEGDSCIFHDFISFDLLYPEGADKTRKDQVFQYLYNEVRWQKMYHAEGDVPRLVCVQGVFGEDGSMPVYRHPSDRALPLLHFSPMVQSIRQQAEKIVGHPLNHVLIQLYRSGQDYISEHSDKTLDIVRGSSIVNVSFGAQRTMRLRTKKPAISYKGEEDGASARKTQRIAMPHNSIFVLGQETNMRWLHGINPDKRAAEDRSEAEKAFSGMRISLTFRHIGTFLDHSSHLIWGQGATSKERSSARRVTNNDELATKAIIHAFGAENQSTEFDWNAVYGAGFDVLHFRSAPLDIPLLFPSKDRVESRQVAIYLAELGVDHLVVEPPTFSSNVEHSGQICYRNTDIQHTEVVGTASILPYLARYYHTDADLGKAVSAAACGDLFKIDELRQSWTRRTMVALRIGSPLNSEMRYWEDRYEDSGDLFIAGTQFSVVDCAMWPVLDDIIRKWDGWSRNTFPHLAAYHRMLKDRECTRRMKNRL